MKKLKTILRKYHAWQKQRRADRLRLYRIEVKWLRECIAAKNKRIDSLEGMIANTRKQINGLFFST